MSTMQSQNSSELGLFKMSRYVEDKLEKASDTFQTWNKIRKYRWGSWTNDENDSNSNHKRSFSGSSPVSKAQQVLAWK